MKAFTHFLTGKQELSDTQMKELERIAQQKKIAIMLKKKEEVMNHEGDLQEKKQYLQKLKASMTKAQISLGDKLMLKVPKKVSKRGSG